MKGSPFFPKCVFDSFRLTTTFRESFCTIKIARFQPDDNVFLRHFAWRFRLECSKYASRQITGNINFFYIFSPEKVPCDKMSLAPIQKLIPDSIRSRKMIEGVFPIFSRNAFFDVSKSARTQRAKFRAGGAEIARRGSSDIFEESAFAPLENTEM